MTSPAQDSLSTYGGAKQNYGSLDPVDQSTDLGASEFNQLAASVAMGTRTQFHCELSFVGIASAPTAVTYEAVWKGTTPTAPTGGRTGTGVYTWTWPATVQDELLDTHTLNLVAAFGQAESATAYHVQASAAANGMTVRVFDMAGTANDAVGATIRVWAR